MRFLRMLLMRVRALVRGDAVDRELGEEIGAHLDRLVEEHMARGVPAGEARALALREFGPVSRIVEDARAARGITWIAQPWQDVRYGARLMRRSPLSGRRSTQPFFSMRSIMRPALARSISSISASSVWLAPGRR